MAMGPKPKPDSLSLNGDALAWTDANEPPPEWMSEAAVPHWNRLRPEIVGKREMSEADRTVLVLVCESLAKWEVATKRVAAEGVTVIGGAGGEIVNPASRVADESWSRVLKGLNYLNKRFKSPASSGTNANTGVDKSRFFRGPRAATG